MTEMHRARRLAERLMDRFVELVQVRQAHQGGSGLDRQSGRLGQMRHSLHLPVAGLTDHVMTSPS